MANQLIKIQESHSQGVREESGQVWCALGLLDTERTMYGDAVDSDNVIKAEYKTVNRGGITCPLCLQFIKQVKSIKL